MNETSPLLMTQNNNTSNNNNIRPDYNTTVVLQELEEGVVPSSNNNIDETDTDETTLTSPVMDVLHGRANQQAQQQQQEQQQEPPSQRMTEADRTQRIRCLFGCLTCPLIPLGLLLGILLVYLFVAAFFIDRTKPCDEPLKVYAGLSVVVTAYIPYHKAVKRYLFGYWRERDGPVRPLAVRMYDELFHATCLTWVWLGVAWVSDCQTCQDTAPHLYKAAKGYVVVLVCCMSLLILPLIFLPCIYIWVASGSRGAGLLMGIDDGNNRGRNNGGAPPEVLEHLQRIDYDPLVFNDISKPRECCICMNDFGDFSHNNNKANGDGDGDGDATRSSTATPLPKQQEGAYSFTDNIHGITTSNSCGSHVISSSSSSIRVKKDPHSQSMNTICTDDNEQQQQQQEVIVQTHCGHVFHKSCLGGWLTTSRFCPLCREDLVPPSRAIRFTNHSNDSSSSSSSSTNHRNQQDPAPSTYNQEVAVNGSDREELDNNSSSISPRNDAAPS